MIKTICRDCIFAEYKGNTQQSCKISMLQKFKAIKNPPKITKAEQDKIYYELNGIFCQFCRDKKWCNRHKLTNTKDCYNKIREDITLSFAAVIIARKNTTLNQIKTTVNTLYKQELPPKLILIIQYCGNKIQHNKIVELMRNDIKWKINSLQDRTYNSIDQSVYFISQHIRIPYFMIFNAGFKIPPDTFSTIDKKVNDELIEFAVITPIPKTSNGIVLPKVMIDTYCTSNYHTILKDLQNTEFDYMIYKIGEICKTYQE